MVYPLLLIILRMRRRNSFKLFGIAILLSVAFMFATHQTIIGYNANFMNTPSGGKANLVIWEVEDELGRKKKNIALSSNENPKKSEGKEVRLIKEEEEEGEKGSVLLKIWRLIFGAFFNSLRHRGTIRKGIRYRKHVFVDETDKVNEKGDDKKQNVNTKIVIERLGDHDVYENDNGDDTNDDNVKSVKDIKNVNNDYERDDDNKNNVQTDNGGNESRIGKGRDEKDKNRSSNYASNSNGIGRRKLEDGKNDLKNRDKLVEHDGNHENDLEYYDEDNNNGGDDYEDDDDGTGRQDENDNQENEEIDKDGEVDEDIDSEDEYGNDPLNDREDDGFGDNDDDNDPD